MKISEIIALNHYCTKPQARKLIRKGEIFYNGKILEEDIDIHEGKLYVGDQLMDVHPLKYVMINKPQGYVCAHKDKQWPCLIDLIEYKHLHYVGRLDQDTTGLVLMTNDLKLRKRLSLPQFHVNKTYQFQTLYPVDLEDIKMLKKGVIIDQNVLCAPAIVEMSTEYTGTITIHEGKYHQIKKMFLSLNNKIIKLKRISIGSLKLDDLKEGHYRSLSEEEINLLTREYHD